MKFLKVSLSGEIMEVLPHRYLHRLLENLALLLHRHLARQERKALQCN
jgi:hypothetical protein